MMHFTPEDIPYLLVVRWCRRRQPGEWSSCREPEDECGKRHSLPNTMAGTKSHVLHLWIRHRVDEITHPWFRLKIQALREIGDRLLCPLGEEPLNVLIERELLLFSNWIWWELDDSFAD